MKWFGRLAPLQGRGHFPWRQEHGACCWQRCAAFGHWRPSEPSPNRALGCLQARESARAAAARADTAAHELLQREEGLAALRAQLEAAKDAAERERRAREEEGEALAKERAKRQRVEDDMKVRVFV